VPKSRYRVWEGPIKESVEHGMRALCQWKEFEVMKLSVQPNHIHLLCSIPPKGIDVGLYGLSERQACDRGCFISYPRLKKKPYWGDHFGASASRARGYFVNTVGMDEDLIRRYVRYQEEEEKKRERQRDNYDLFS
jgi:putative transposase